MTQIQPPPPLPAGDVGGHPLPVYTSSPGDADPSEHRKMWSVRETDGQVQSNKQLGCKNPSSSSFPPVCVNETLQLAGIIIRFFSPHHACLRVTPCTTEQLLPCHETNGIEAYGTGCCSVSRRRDALWHPAPSGQQCTVCISIKQKRSVQKPLPGERSDLADGVLCAYVDTSLTRGRACRTAGLTN